MRELLAPVWRLLIHDSPCRIVAPLAYHIDMTVEMIREKVTRVPDHISARANERTSSDPDHNSGRLATQAELDNLDELIDAAERHNGPVSDEALDQFYADLAAADAEIGRIR